MKGVRAAVRGSSTWRVPNPYGYASGIETAGSVAAPLLAGFAGTLIVLVIQNASDLRWPNAALVVLTAATILLIMAVQASFSARQYAVTPDEIEAWWPDLNAETWIRIRSEQFGHKELLDLWLGRFRLTYNLGIFFFLLALPIVLVPPVRHAKEAPIPHSRWAAVAIAAFGALAELLWMVANALSRRYGRFASGYSDDPTVLSRLVLRLVPASREVIPDDIRCRNWPEWFSEEDKRVAEKYVPAKGRGPDVKDTDWSEAVIEIVIMLYVLALMTAAAVAGWLLGRKV